MRRIAAILLGLGLLAAGPAAAVVAFPRADANKDGFVTYDEARRKMPELQEVSFRKFDKNGDGRLDRGEYAGLDGFYSLIKQD